ncbi:MAG: NAD-dependent epimerase/dehydratase family protein [Phycisphaerales bacterium]
MTTHHAQSAHSSSEGARRTSAILITGAGGEIGHGLIEQLAARPGSIIVALDLHELEPSLREKCQAAYVGDICDNALLTRVLAKYEITEIYHLAALLSTRAEYVPAAAHDVNVRGTLNLLELAAEQARSHGQRVRFMFPSSIAVYGMPDQATKKQAGKVHEREWCQPATMYGCNKLYCEHLGRYYDQHYRQLAKDRIREIVDFRAIRFPGIISAHTLPSGGTSDFAPEMIHAAAQAKPYACFVRADTRIPFMSMPDAIAALLTLAGASEASLTQVVYNIGAFNPSAGEFAERVQQAFPGAEITFEPDEQRQAIVDSWPEDVNDDAARADWNYAPSHTLERAFTEYLVPVIKARYQ